MNKALLLALIFFVAEFHVFAQDTPVQEYSLFEIVDLALGRSPAALQAETRRENRYWQWRAFQSNYMPRIYLSGELPNFTRANEPITQEDGTVEFRPVSQNFSELNLFATQSIGYLGTEIFLNSNIEL